MIDARKRRLRDESVTLRYELGDRVVSALILSEYAQLMGWLIRERGNA